jgi:YD repeat-containing protein
VASTYDDASQLTTVGGVPVTHDAAGNLAAAQDTTYDWDWLGRMTEVDGPAVPSGNATYTYDGDGVRVAQDTGGGVEQLLYDRLTHDGAPDLVQDGDEDFLHLRSSRLRRGPGDPRRVACLLCWQPRLCRLPDL